MKNRLLVVLFLMFEIAVGNPPGAQIYQFPGAFKAPPAPVQPIGGLDEAITAIQIATTRMKSALNEPVTSVIYQGAQESMLKAIEGISFEQFPAEYQKPPWWDKIANTLLEIPVNDPMVSRAINSKIGEFSKRNDQHVIKSSFTMAIYRQLGIALQSKPMDPAQWNRQLKLFVRMAFDSTQLDTLMHIWENAAEENFRRHAFAQIKRVLGAERIYGFHRNSNDDLISSSIEKLIEIDKKRLSQGLSSMTEVQYAGLYSLFGRLTHFHDGIMRDYIVGMLYLADAEGAAESIKELALQKAAELSNKFFRHDVIFKRIEKEKNDNGQVPRAYLRVLNRLELKGTSFENKRLHVVETVKNKCESFYKN